MNITPSIPRLYSYMNKVDNPVTTTDIATIFATSRPKAYTRLSTLSEMKFVEKIYYSGMYFYMTRPLELVMDSEIIFSGRIIGPIPVSVDFKIVQELRKPKTKVRKLREWLADKLLNIIYNIVDIIAPDYYTGFDAW